MFARNFEIRLPTFPIWIIGNTKLQQARYGIVLRKEKQNGGSLTHTSLLSESFGTFRGNFQLVMA